MTTLGFMLDEEYSRKLEELAVYQNCSAHKVIVDAIDIMHCVLTTEEENENGI